MTAAQVAAALAGLLLSGLALFHAALAMGAPLGRFAWGGANPGALPPRLQVGSAITLPLLLAMAMIVLIRAGLVYAQWAPAMVWPHWLVFLYLIINTFAALRSESSNERRTLGPLMLAAAILVGFVAIRLG